MSSFFPLKVKDDVRDETLSALIFDSALMISSAIPSAKKSPSGSELHLAAGWVLTPDETLKSEVPGWRLTIDAGSTDFEHVLEAAARTGAAFVRSPRSRVAELARISSLPGLITAVSVFVDDVHQAVAAVESGGTDLLLRGMAYDRLGEDARGIVAWTRSPALGAMPRTCF